MTYGGTYECSTQYSCTQFYSFVHNSILLYIMLDVVIVHNAREDSTRSTFKPSKNIAHRLLD